MGKVRTFARRRGALILGIVAALAPALTHAAAGRVQFAFGDVVGIDEDGNERRLRRGASLEQGDTVRTSGGARAQIRFTDGAYTSLQPNTEFRIDGYEFDEKKVESSRSFFSLLKGGLRTITGTIGRLRERAYRVTTPVATIGVRGTEYTAVLGNSLEVNVGLGTITASNDAGTLVITNGESAFIAGAESYPLLTPDKPVLPPPVVGQRTEDGDTESTDYQLGTDFRTIANTLEGLLDEDDSNLTTGSGFRLAVAYGGRGSGRSLSEPVERRTAQVSTNGDGSGIYQRGSTFAVFNDSGELVTFVTADEDTPQLGIGLDFDELVAELSDLLGEPIDVDDDVDFPEIDLVVNEADSIGETLGWGRWTGTFAVGGDEYDDSDLEGVLAGLDPNQGHHYIIGRPTSIEDMAGQTGNVAFNLVGGTRPTVSDGSLEPGNLILNGSQLTAHFDTESVSLDLRFQLGGGTARIDTRSAGQTLPIDGATFAGSGNFATATVVPGQIYTKVEGFFAGDEASAAGVAYKLSSYGYDGDSSRGPVTGVAAFARGGAGLPPPSDSR